MNAQPTLEKLESSLKAAWCRATCWPPMRKDWTKERPEHGQCLVSSLVVSEYYGGSLVMANVKVPGLEDPVLHFFNRLKGGDVDTTWVQFPEGRTIAELDLKDPKNHKLYRQCLDDPEMHIRLSKLLGSVRAKINITPAL